MAIFVSSPDSYADVFRVFLECYRKFWPDSPYELVLATNGSKYEGITVYNNGATDDGWMDRAIPAIARLPHEFILLLCDDCLISQRVDNRLVRSVLQDMRDYELDFCGLMNHIPGKALHSGSLVDRVRKDRPYALNLQAGIYRRSFLLRLLGDGERNPWQLEELWLREAGRSPREYFPNVVSCRTNVLHLRHGVLKGKWFASVINEMGERGVPIHTERETIPLSEERRLAVMSRLGKLLPARWRYAVKRILKKAGREFATDH